MKSRNKYTRTTGSNSEGISASEQNIADAAKFHAIRIAIERTTDRIRQFANRPSGNDEIQQYIAENAVSDKISETAFLIAENRGPAPGNANSDWLKAEFKVEDVLDTDFIDRRISGTAERRITVT